MALSEWLVVWQIAPVAHKRAIGGTAELLGWMQSLDRALQVKILATLRILCQLEWLHFHRYEGDCEVKVLLRRL